MIEDPACLLLVWLDPTETRRDTRYQTNQSLYCTYVQWYAWKVWY
jgi:hypothetical protein